jgi:putrescine importer
VLLSNNLQQPSLQRVLSLGDLIRYGIVLIQPIAAVPLFGIADQLSEGHVITTILIAMVAMMLTAVSYGRMATLYPTSGSAYAYVGRGINRQLGFLTGWAMLLDYFMIPVLNTIYGSLTICRLYPTVPYVAVAFAFAVLITLLNLRDVRTTASANLWLLAVMSVVIVAFFVWAVTYLTSRYGPLAIFSFKPFYTPSTFHLASIAEATSLASLTYIGFDGITTLTEEARHPERDVERATVLVCAITGILSGLQVYFAQLVWPDYKSFANPDTAFMDVATRVGGHPLFLAFALTLAIASIGSGLAGQAGAARLLFSMGRDRALPEKLFAHIGRKSGVPTFNICLIGAVAFAGSLLFSFERAAELVNFGAFLAFIGVNVAAVRHSFITHRKLTAIIPALGGMFCILIWWSLPRPSKIAGFAWLAIGLIYALVLSKGFGRTPALGDLES